MAKDVREGKLKIIEKKSVTQEDAPLSEPMIPENTVSIEIEKTVQHIKKTRVKKEKAEKSS